MPSDVNAEVRSNVEFQQAAFTVTSLASPLYHRLLGVVLEDLDAGGPSARVLAQVPADVEPWADAVTLRFLGGVHRLVLTGRAPELATWFPTAGVVRSLDDDPAGAFRDVVEAHEAELVASLGVGVQTNEMARCAVLAVGFTEIARRTGLPLRLLEVGASAGLNLLWDRWWYRSGATSWGRPDAEVRFESNYVDPTPDVSAPLGPGELVAARRGCDRSPIDPTSDDGRLLLRSFVWPDQADRHARLDAALAAAAEAGPAPVDRADAAAWVADQLAEPAEGVATVVYHSIVWQYLPAETKEGVRAAIEAAGAAARPDAPVAWFRMEPVEGVPSEAAAVGLRLWAGRGDGSDGADEVVARCGFHGHPVWSGTADRPG